MATESPVSTVRTRLSEETSCQPATPVLPIRHSCSRLDFTVYAVNRLPFVKASCRSLETPLSASEGVVHHPFVAFFTSFARAKATACWLSECGEEVYVHRFRANQSVEGRWHPMRPGQTINHPTQMCHYAATGIAFRDWPVQRELEADKRSGISPREPVSAVLVGVNAAPEEEPQLRHHNFFTVGVFTSEVRAKACVAERGHAAVSICPITLNAPLFPCLSSALLSAHQTRLLVRSAMMYVDYSEDAERDGGVMSDIMAQVWDLVLDRHQHPHQAKPARRAVALLEQGAVAVTEGPPCTVRQRGELSL
ncbi:g4442 [Coccomyxa elongata]